MYSAVYYRLTSLLLLLGLLSSCSVYDHFFHPHRLGTPPMTASAKAKAKAAEKARHKGLTLGTTEEAKDATAPASADGAAAPAPAPADTRSADDKNKAIANMLGNTYDKKTGLLKRSKLQRMDYSSHALHHYDLRAPKHTDATRDARKLRKHPKTGGKGKETPEPKAPHEPSPAPDPTQPAAPKAKAAPKVKAKPAAAPAEEAAPAPRQNPGKPKADKKSKKQYPKGYKPDPTQPQDGN